MSKMSRKYGKSKSHSGAGLQFDKLLKACSNSKKASATKTAGALGRFGIASFTSTRNASFDIDSAGEDETRPSSLLKRPRIDTDRHLSQMKPDHFHYSHSHGQNSGNALVQNTQKTAPVPTVFKPRKFFKSRAPMQVEETPGTITRPEITTLMPPILPITIPIPKPVSQKRGRGSGKKGPGRPKHSSTGGKQTLHNATNVSPPVTLERSNNSITSPSIKLRIFKDKATSEFVSVADTSALPPVLERQGIENSNQVFPVPKKRGRPGRPKAIREVDAIVKPKKERKQREPAPVLTPRKSGRVTRNSRRQRNSDSIGDMPILSAVADNNSEYNDTNRESPSSDLFSGSPPNITSREVPVKALELVERLEEDSEFREMSAVLSSMEGDVENELEERQYNEEKHDEQTRSPEAFPNDYSQKSGIPTESFQVESLSPKPPRDFRSMLEDEWDESYDEDSPRKAGSSPCKVSRFHMPEFEVARPQPTYARRDSTKKGHDVADSHEIQQSPVALTTSQRNPEPFNAPYAVRNLLSEFTEREEVPNLGSPKDFEAELDKVGLSKSPEKSTAPQPVTTRAAKKISIFKSRNTAETIAAGQAGSPKKRLALYKHKFAGQETAERQEAANKPVEQGLSPNSGFDEDYEGESSGPIELRRVPRTDKDRAGNDVAVDGARVYCKQENKKLFTVIRNVKAIHELQESGEVHEFDGDIWYILSDLKDSNPMASRCLSAITLAMRCMEPAFRMHLRAHGTVAEFCKELHDAPNNPVLALLAATVLFVLSQDRLNMDLDTESLQLILALAKTEQKTHLGDANQELGKHRQRVIDLVTEINTRGHAKLIKIDKITASELALETLLYLTSKRAGEWVKLELRTLGGLDYIVSEIGKSLNSLKLDVNWNGWSESALELLWKIDRCLKVLHQVTFNHEDNQKYLLGCQKFPEVAGEGESSSPDVFVKLFQYLSESLCSGPLGTEASTVLREILFSVLRVLVNLTHDYRGIILGSEVVAAKENFLQLTLHSIFTLSPGLPEGKGFDLLMHSLCMLLNLVEHSLKIRELVLGMTVKYDAAGDNCDGRELSTLDALIRMFFIKEQEARKEEASTDDILTNSTDPKEPKDSQNSTSDPQKSSQESSKDSDSSQDIIDKLIQTAGKHMENSMIAAHVSLLIAYLIMDNPVSTEYVRNSMPDSKFLPLMTLLKKLFNFMSITSSASGSTRGLKATSIALNFFAKCDPESNEALKKIIPD